METIQKHAQEQRVPFRIMLWQRRIDPIADVIVSRFGKRLFDDLASHKILGQLTELAYRQEDIPLLLRHYLNQAMRAHILCVLSSSSNGDHVLPVTVTITQLASKMKKPYSYVYDAVHDLERLQIVKIMGKGGRKGKFVVLQAVCTIIQDVTA